MATRSGRRLNYATDVDPSMSTFGWKVIGLTYLAVLLPGLGAFFPRDVPVDWPFFWIAIVSAAFTLSVNALHLQRMIASHGYDEPAAHIVLAEVVFGTVAAALLNYSLSGEIGIYRPLVFIPTLLLAMIANRLMIAISWAVAVVCVTASASAQGVAAEHLVAFAVSYGAAWGVAAVMVHLLAATSLRSDGQMRGLADAATIAARATTLVDGLDQMAPVIGESAEAEQVAAYRLGPSGPELLARWPADLEPAPPPSDAEIAAVLGDAGQLVDRDRRVLIAQGADGDQVAVVIAGAEYAMIDVLTNRFDLERMSVQVEILMNRSRYIERLENLGMTDGLTGLPNRRALTTRLGDEVRAAARRGTSLSVGMLDLDEFKAFNDTRGHLAGDDLLRHFSDILRARLRAVDFVARYGGEEFCVVLPDTDARGAEVLLAEIHAELRASAEFGSVTFSAGIAIWCDGESPDDLIRRADEALYAAKAAGKDRTTLAAGR